MSPRSSPYDAADVGGKQATETKKIPLSVGASPIAIVTIALNNVGSPIRIIGQAA
jgi:hypothetical protein